MRIRVVLPILVALALPGAADAATVQRGETAQGKRVAVNVGPDGRVRRVTVAWTATCANGKLGDDSAIVLRAGTRTAFRGTGTYTLRRKGGLRTRVTLTVRGTRSGERWSGTLRGDATVRRGRKVRDRCRLRSTAWSTRAAGAPPSGAPSPGAPAGSAPAAGAPAAPAPSAPAPTPGIKSPALAIANWSLAMTSDGYVGQGRSWNHSPATGDTLTTSGDGATFLTVEVDTPDGWWTLDFAAPAGATLTPGTRYTDAQRYAFRGTAAGLSVSGYGRACDSSSGEFTVHELVWGATGAPTRFKASFTHLCGSAGERGTIDVGP